MIARDRGFDSVASTIGVILLLNLAFSFGTAHVSLGGHLGGLVVGVICALVIVAGERGMLGRQRLAAELIAIGVVAMISIAAAIAVA